MDYAHTVEIGVCLRPGEAAPGIAQKAEGFGYDLVMLRDDPDHPGGIEVWTLSAWVGARTGRVRIMAGVKDLAFRVPAVLGRAAASLDLLSSGRVRLVLGSDVSEGAFGEALDVVRGMLDAPEGPLRYGGEHYGLYGARGGPAPERDVPVWVEGDEPWLLRLAGSKAEGWVSGVRDAGALHAANEILDGAAREAGRDPREIRRAIVIPDHSGTPDEWVGELSPLVEEGGVRTLLLETGDISAMERFASRVAPVLREVTAKRPSGIPPRPPRRRAAVRARRRAGIDYERIPPSLAESAVEPGDPGYKRVRSTYLRGGSPGLVLRPENTGGVVEALSFAREHPHVPLSIRSGGHGISGRSTNDGGIVIDLSRMNATEVSDAARRRVKLGPGARWMDVASALAPHGLALSSGDYGGVGVGGLATAGGIGWLCREHGLTIDRLRAVEMVLADGSVVHASEEENRDLFWAVRGAGANFGIATSFELEACEVGEVGWAQFVVDAGDAAGLLERWGAVVEASPRDLTSFLIISPSRRRPPVGYVLAVVDSDEPQTILDRLEPLAGVAPVYDQNVVITPYADIMANARGSYHDARGEPSARSGLAGHITPGLASEVARLLQSGATYYFQVRSVGGAVSDVDPEATAYAHRRANFHLTAFGASQPALNAVWDGGVYRHLSGLYLSFETDLRPERLADAFPPRTLARLRRLKALYDPDNVFRDNFNLAPAGTSHRREIPRSTT